MGHMIDALAGWSCTLLPDGAEYRAPDGDDVIRIRLTEHPPDLTDPEMLVTADGEPAILLVTDLGMIAAVGDGPVLLVEATGGSPALPLLVRALVDRCSPGAGSARRRAFPHCAPAGWARTRGHQKTVWSDGRGARITVFDARPIADGTAESLDRFLFVRGAGSDMTEVGERELLAIHGLSGWLSAATGRDRAGAPLLCLAAAVADDRFAHLASLEAPPGDREAARTFRALVASFRPVVRRPAPTTDSPLAWMAD